MTSSQSGGARAASNIAPPPSQLEQPPPLTLGHHTLEVLPRTLGSSSEPCVDVAHSGESASELRADMLSSSSISSALPADVNAKGTTPPLLKRRDSMAQSNLENRMLLCFSLVFLGVPNDALSRIGSSSSTVLKSACTTDSV